MSTVVLNASSVPAQEFQLRVIFTFKLVCIKKNEALSSANSILVVFWVYVGHIDV